MWNAQSIFKYEVPPTGLCANPISSLWYYLGEVLETSGDRI